MGKTEWEKYRKEHLQRFFSRLLLGLSFALLFLLLGFIDPQIFFALLIMSTIGVIFVLKQKATQFTTKQGVKITFTKPSQFVPKEEYDIFFDKIIIKWSNILHRDPERLTDILVKLRVFIVDDTFMDVRHGNIVYAAPLGQDIYFEFDTHQWIAEKLMPQFSYPFRQTILKRFKII